ncbi:hypothetical protein [Catalinimonas niigatensis]|uniref:hypothetical protein n=1 Tax=Catalinimonas niigatensis TaxID=1397264 RepID=UPI002666D5CB|nr:hypothetical protein [Catalinimonas niigatensis]WPP51862.1 hypothetical protein PZB72_05605 [Catalinimonas niigatensis]
MNPFIPFLFLSAILFQQAFFHANAQNQLTKGRQPHVSVDPQGVMRIVFGINDSIMVMNSSDRGKTFSEPELVGQLEGMHLGMSRGPQIASSAHYSIITAMDKKGDIHAFRLEHATDQWQKMANINDQPASAPEGLMSIAADQNDHFFAVWLDIRTDQKNKIVVAKYDAGEQWSKNVIAYQSPDGTVCECCKPNIAVKDQQIYVMFRNWLNGKRDMYLMTSDSEKLSFNAPQKLGDGSWPLKGCPMDGGDIFIDSQDHVHTTWQREGKIYYSQPGKSEVLLGEGRSASISGSKNPLIAWQDSGMLKAKFLSSNKIIPIGEGAFVEVVVLDDKNIFCVWEKEGEIFSKQLQ